MTDKKRTDHLDWEDLRYFVALARHGSLSATARALRVNHATVSRRVGCLEAALGKPLFDRRAEGYALTAEGKAILDEAQPMEEAALSVLRRLDRDVALGGLVRLTTTRVLADGFLVDHLGNLNRRYPEIDLELLTESRMLSLARREADIALRFGSPKDSDLLARRVATIGYGFFGCADWVERVSAQEAPPLIGFDSESSFIAEAAWLAREFPGSRIGFRSNSWTAQATAAKNGFGVALLPRYLVARIAGLAPISLGKEPPSRDLWMLVRRDLAAVPRVRAVVDYLVVLFEEQRREF